MVIDVAHNPRIAQLVGRLEEIRRRAQEHPPGHPERLALEERVDAFYVEVGRYVHWLVRQDPDALARLAEEGRRWAERMDEELGIERLPEVSAEELQFEDLGDEESHDGSATHTKVELTGDSRVEAVDVRELVEVEPVSEPAASTADRPRDAVPELSEDALFALEEDTSASDASGGVEVVGVAVRTGSFPAADAAGGEAPDAALADDGAWLERLRALLDVLGPPRVVPADQEGRELLVRSLSQATTNLEVGWAMFPDAVQQALLGLVGARARRLQHEAAAGDDADIHLALGRMRRYAAQRGLLMVPALREDGDGRNWNADERRYWAVLHAGM